MPYLATKFTLSVPMNLFSTVSSFRIFISFTKSVDLSRTIWVKYNNRRFKIANPENIDEDNLYLRLRAIERGTVLQEANKI